MSEFNLLYESAMQAVTITKLAKDDGLDISEFDIKELQMGMDVEKEHDGGEGDDIDVVKTDLDILKIVLAHLREDKEYYSKLDTLGL